MDSRQDIEAAVRQLTRTELAAFRDWFMRLDGQTWDRQFAQDVAAGRLDARADEALGELRSGYCSELEHPLRVRSAENC